MELPALLLLFGAGFCLLHWLRKPTPHQRELHGLAPLNRTTLNQRFARDLPTNSTDLDRAQLLVNDIALHNDVVLFKCSHLEQDTHAPSDLIHDILDALCPTVKTVDVSRDSGMRMGLPHVGNAPLLPCVYIGGRLLGGEAEVMDALRSDKMINELVRAKVDYDKNVAAGLIIGR